MLTEDQKYLPAIYKKAYLLKCKGDHHAARYLYIKYKIADNNRHQYCKIDQTARPCVKYVGLAQLIEGIDKIEQGHVCKNVYGIKGR